MLLFYVMVGLYVIRIHLQKNHTSASALCFFIENCMEAYSHNKFAKAREVIYVSRHRGFIKSTCQEGIIYNPFQLI